MCDRTRERFAVARLPSSSAHPRLLFSAQRGVVMNCVGSMVTSFPCGVCAGDLGVATAHFSVASFRSVIPLAPLADRSPGTSPNARPFPSPPMANSGVPASSSGAALSDTSKSLGGRRFFTGAVRVPTADARSVALAPAFRSRQPRSRARRRRRGWRAAGLSRGGRARVSAPRHGR